jgi:hypothetical protein
MSGPYRKPLETTDQKARDLTVNEQWREYREEQWQRRQKRVRKRTEELRRRLPPGYTMEILNDGSAIRITAEGFKLVWYPVHLRAQYLGQWMTMQLETVLRLLRTFPRKEHESGVRDPDSDPGAVHA